MSGSVLLGVSCTAQLHTACGCTILIRGWLFHLLSSFASTAGGDAQTALATATARAFSDGVRVLPDVLLLDRSCTHP